MEHAAAWLERHQVSCYLVAIVVAIGFGIMAPAVASPLAGVIEPAIAVLLFVTFLGVPFGRLAVAFRDWRFLGAVLVINFVVVPLVVWALLPLLPRHEAVILGALLVLLAPCIDYVIVFTGVAGGARDRLLAATPLLMLFQLVLLPVYVALFIGPDLTAALDPAPFVHAFIWLVAVPLGAAILTQLGAASSRTVAAGANGAMHLMVPLMLLVLVCVVSSQLAELSGSLRGGGPSAPGGRDAAAEIWGPLAQAAAVYLLFGVVMVALGVLGAWIARLGVAAGRALVFSGMTRNSLVVLPLALALPSGAELAPLTVVTQTLVELMLLVVCVRLVPILLPERTDRAAEATASAASP